MELTKKLTVMLRLDALGGEEEGEAREVGGGWVRVGKGEDPPPRAGCGAPGEGALRIPSRPMWMTVADDVIRPTAPSPHLMLGSGVEVAGKW